MYEKPLLPKAENIETIESVERQIKEVDWDVLQSLFSQELAKARIDTKVVQQRISAETIDINGKDSEFSSLAGQYDPFSERVILYPNILLRTAREIFADPNIDPSDTRFKSMFLGLLIHEQTHAISYQELDHSNVAAGFQKIKYETVEDSMLPTEDLGGGSLNEATTDMIASEIFTAYGKAVGLDTEPYFDLYKMPILLNEFFLNYIANIASVPREIVWRGLKEAYLKGTDLNSSELGDEFTLIYKKLAGADASTSEITALKTIKEIPLTEISLDSKQRIQVGIREIIKYFENDMKKSGEYFKTTPGFEDYDDYYTNMREEAERTIKEIESIQADVEKKYAP